MTRAVTNRQSMAIVIAILIQDDFSSIASPPLRERPAGRTSGLRTDNPIFRADLFRYRIHTRKDGVTILGSIVLIRR